MKRLLFAALFLAAFTFLASAQDKPKYVFLFIGDGMSTPQRMVAEEFALKTGYGELAINHLPYHATTRTRSANSLVTDSAASGTALACGSKTNNGMLGVTPDGKSVESSAAIAHKNGKKVGIVTTVTINHATPGAFYAHQLSRSSYYKIGLELTTSGFEYFAGGGVDKAEGDPKSKDFQGDVYDLAAKAGYTVIRLDAAAFRALKPGCGKVLFSAAPKPMPYAIDSAAGDVTLAELTAKGVELLDNPNGFFMMVEGGKIDYAGHANDAATNLREVLELDRAVKVALDFAKKHPAETLIIVTGDHETGGMSMGFAQTGYALYTENLLGQTCSTTAFAKKLRIAQKGATLSFEDVKPLLRECYGFAFAKDEKGLQLKEQEIAELQKAFEEKRLPDAARILIAHKSGISWSTGAHSALPVLTTSTGCGAANFTGFIENTEVSNHLKPLL